MKRLPQVAVIGGNEKSCTNNDYEMALEVGKILVDSSCRILTGGYGGVMEAVSKGGKSSSNYKEGVIVAIIPDLNKKKVNDFSDIIITTGMGFSRNQILVASSDLVVAIGGGAGTLNELTYAWQLVKTIFAFKTSGWSKKLAGKFIDKRLEKPIIPIDSISDFKNKLDEFLTKFYQKD
ncbi:MAG: TIGR00725 family protein [Candidatus Heimdallarchaeota archaeon]